MNKDILIDYCNCARSPATDEWETDIDMSFMLEHPQSFIIFDKEYCIDRITLKDDYFGMEKGAVEIPDLGVLSFSNGINNYYFIDIDLYIIKEIADKLEALEMAKDKRLNGCLLSDSLYELLE